MQIDDSRRFAASFGMAWQLWTTHFTAFLRIMWQPCLMCVAVVAAWLLVRPDGVTGSMSIGSVATDFIAGAALLFVWSMMRTMQTDAIADIEANGRVLPKRFVRHIVSIAKRSWRPYIPLIAAWLAVMLVLYVMLLLDVGGYVILGSMLAVLVVVPPIEGIMQSYVEVKPKPVFPRMWRGLRLSRRYWGGMLSLWIISALMIAVMCAVLCFGILVLIYVFNNRREALMQAETVEIPSYVNWLTACVLALAAWLVSFAQSLWSLPQQVHIRSIIYKERKRAKDARQPSADAKTENKTLKT